MALISIRNLVAPFENKTHLFTVVVVAAIFGVWRASGGSVTSQPIPSSANGTEFRATKKQAAFREQKGFSNRTPRNGNNSLPASKGLTPKTASSSSRNDLDTLLAPQQQVEKPASAQKHHSALDDIEKSLGMR